MQRWTRRLALGVVGFGLGLALVGLWLVVVLLSAMRTNSWAAGAMLLGLCLPPLVLALFAEARWGWHDDLSSSMTFAIGAGAAIAIINGPHLDQWWNG